MSWLLSAYASARDEAHYRLQISNMRHAEGWIPSLSQAVCSSLLFGSTAIAEQKAGLVNFLFSTNGWAQDFHASSLLALDVSGRGTIAAMYVDECIDNSCRE